jgi:ribonuclease HI
LACGETSLHSNSTEEAVQIVEKIDALSFDLSCPVDYQWVRAHNGNEYNEMADELAYEHAHPID